ncbi:hypothetical protein [Microbacterium oleivorans]|nr:hypothetical protein [Microbacterium oleivorans]
MVIHDVAAVEKVCDRVVVLDRGRMVHEGPAADLMSTSCLS